MQRIVSIVMVALIMFIVAATGFAEEVIIYDTKGQVRVREHEGRRWRKAKVGEQLGEDYEILTKRSDSDTNRWGMSMSAGNNIGFGIRDASGWNSWTTNSGPIASSTWYHVAVTYDAVVDAKIYINGQNVSAPRNGSIVPISVNTRPVRIGCYVNGSNPRQNFGGLIDEVRLYNRALSDAEIERSYVPIFFEILMISCLSSPINGLKIDIFIACSTTRKFFNV